MRIQLHPHRYRDGEVIFAVGDAQTDTFSEALKGNWKPGTHILAADRFLGPGDLFFDLGANVGTFCLPVALTSGASCIAVEALQSNIPYLMSAIQANGLHGRVEWWLAAIVEADGEVRIKGESAYGTVGKGDVGRRVVAYSIDSLMEELAWPDVKLVKMDIEGCEMRALQGAERFLDRNPEATFVFEANAAHCFSNGYQPQDLIKFFELRGYQTYLAKSGRIIPRTSLDFQESGVSDYIATRVSVEEKLSEFKLQDFNLAQKRAEVVRMLTKMNEGYRKQMVSQMHLAPTEIRSDPEIERLCVQVMES